MTGGSCGDDEATPCVDVTVECAGRGESTKSAGILLAPWTAESGLCGGLSRSADGGDGQLEALMLPRSAAVDIAVVAHGRARKARARETTSA